MNGWAFDKRTAWLSRKPGVKCPACNMERTKEGHDPCLGELPGVKFACCGHGYKRGYIYFENGVILRFWGRRVEYVDERTREDSKPPVVLARSDVKETPDDDGRVQERAGEQDHPLSSSVSGRDQDLPDRPDKPSRPHLHSKGGP